MKGWDDSSGIRERLALVAAVGKTDPTRWIYDSHHDRWALIGFEGTKRHIVRQEGQRSLELIAERYGMDRKAAMSYIGYPETTR